MTGLHSKVAVRSFSKRPGLTLALVGSLALGVGVNVAVFSLAKAVLIEPLPFRDPDGIFLLWERNFPRDRMRNVVSPRNFVAWKEASRSFATMTALVPRRLTFSGSDAPAMLPVLDSTEGLFEILGVRPSLGRTFSAEELGESSAVVVITDAMWRSRLASDPNVLGKTILLEDEPHEIVGVMPPSFRFEIPGTSYSFPIEPLIFRPRSIPSAWLEQGGRSLAVLARTAAGVDARAAQVEMSAIAERLRKQYPESNTGWGVTVVSLKEQIVGESRAVLLLLWVAVSAMLAIVAVNVANLLLGRALGRRREIAIRTALGAGGSNILGQLLVESFILTSAATALGLGLAFGALRALKRGSPIALPRLEAVTVDGGVLLYALAAAVLLTLVFGLVPVLQSRRTDVQRALREEGSSTSSAAGHSRLRAFLVVSEVALAVALVSGAGLLLRTLQALRNAETGFDRNGVVTLTVGLPNRYDSDVERGRFFGTLVSRTAALPGVEAAGIVSSLPLTGPHAATSFWAGEEPEPPRGEAPVADIRIIRGDYFRAMSIPLIAGRLFDPRDGRDAPPRAIVSGEALRTIWPGLEPSDVLGREVVVSWGEALRAQVVGVVGDVRHRGVDVTPRAMIYWPHEQNAWSDMTLVARASDPDSKIAAVLAEIRKMDPGVAATDVGTLAEIFDASVADRRVSSFVLGLFAALALGLASLGVYGVVSLTAAARTREMSLRLALGATPSRLVRLVLVQGLLPVALGLALGLGGALLASRLVASMLYGVSPTDPTTLGLAVAALLLVASAAAYLPARRASRLPPAIALRSE